MNDTHKPKAKTQPAREILTGVPDGLGPLVLAQLIDEARAGQGASSPPPLLLHVARDDRRLEALTEGLKFFAPQVRVIAFPAWDTVPYDRIGPNAQIVATRVAALARLVAGTRCRMALTVVSTTVGALRAPATSRASAAMRVATICAFGPMRS